MVGSFLLTLLPILVIVCMLVIFKKSADISGIVGWLCVSAVAFLFFNTSLEVILRSTISGIIRSFPVSLIVLTSLFMMAYMEKTGALKRIIIFIKTISSHNKAVQIMMINIGFGTLMVAVGATPVSLLPPILIAMGYSTYVAIALPSIGYDALCTYALLGAPVVAFVDFANRFLGPGNEITPSQAGSIFYMFLPVVSTLIGFCMLYIVDKWNGIKKGFLPCIVTGGVIAVVAYFTNKVDNLVTLTGVLCGLAVIVVMALYLKVTGKNIIDRSNLTEEEKAYEKQYPLWKALSPWIILIGLILALNLPKPAYDFLYNLKLPINGIAVDGKGIVTRAVWNAYTWIAVAVVISMLFIRPKASQVKESFKVWWKRAPRPVFSAAIFFAIGEIMNYSNWSMETMKYQSASMIKVLADVSANAFSGAYGFITGFIGLFGGFITGSEASTIAMFANYTMETAKNLNMGLNGLIIATAALAFGGGLASVISPAKLQNAAASIDKLGEENKVIRIAFVFALILTFVTSVYAMLLLQIGVNI
ncbi:L-lactate permease [Ruminiclostridium cellobioparum]|jgi:lactate permease|uniref:L-lactate permease n=1 Tax=Ruminiclostridium cellobioparum TaxID=29355 RepID=UPI000489714E|nr:L-lactate permease [Ruminiclostridium cellobioparum]